jgi:hypothetical protein
MESASASGGVATRATAAAAAQALRTLSHLRGRRIFHPFGVGFHGRLIPVAGASTGATALDEESEILVRLSRALGLPEWLPDPCGLGLRIPDAHGPGRHQDILLVSSGSAPLARHTISPARGFLDRPYSSVLPYELGGELVMLGAGAAGAAGRGPTLADLRMSERAELDLELLLADMRGEWRPVARLELGRRMPPEETERLELDPTNTGGGLRLAGLVNRLRGPSYRGSQEGRASARGA